MEYTNLDGVERRRLSTTTTTTITMMITTIKTMTSPTIRPVCEVEPTTQDIMPKFTTTFMTVIFLGVSLDKYESIKIKIIINI